MSNKKSILEQALLQIETLEEAVKANAKGILSSTMKNELNGLLEQIEKEEEETDEIPGINSNDVDEQDTEEEPSLEDEESSDNEEEEESLEGGEENPFEDEENEIPDGDEEFGPEDGEEVPEDGEEDTLDMTDASDSEVLRVFKAMKSEDGIVVKRDGNTIELQDGENDYVIKLDNLEEQFTGEEETPEDEDIYEIVLDDNDDDDQEECEMKEDNKVPFVKPTKKVNTVKTKQAPETKNVKAGEFSESARTQGFGYHGGLESKKVFKSGNKREEINEEIVKLKKQNGEYKKALGLFKEKLNEIAVFNANLAFATRIFTEHTTTKKEKLAILERFDSIATITESKNLYNSINSEFSNKKPMTESVVDKITSNPKTSTTEILSESKAYENPQFARMRDLMVKIK